MWINKQWSLQRLHLEVFKFFSGRLHILIDVQKNLPLILNEEGEIKHLSMEEFEALSLEQKFKVFFPTLNEENWKDLLSKTTDFKFEEALYLLKLKNMSGYMESCHFCGDKKCDGCPVPFDSKLTVNDLFIKLGITSNDSFYSDGYKRGKNDVIIEICWNPKTEKTFFESF